MSQTEREPVLTLENVIQNSGAAVLDNAALNSDQKRVGRTRKKLPRNARVCATPASPPWPQALGHSGHTADRIRPLVRPRQPTNSESRSLPHATRLARRSASPGPAIDSDETWNPKQ